MNLWLARIPLEQEIHADIKSIKPEKAPGYGGFTSGFYQHFWDIVKREFLDLVIEFFQGRVSLKRVNSTFITLIPKSRTTIAIHEFRPISGINANYKIISIFLASRLSQVTTDLISWHQTTFVPGRFTSDNFTLAEESVCGFNQKTVGWRVCINLDLTKAFDSITWGVVEYSQIHGFRYRGFIRTIMDCITSPRFSNLIEGEAMDQFNSERGLRQGESISLTLFIMILEIFSQGIDLTVLNKEYDSFILGWTKSITR